MHEMSIVTSIVNSVCEKAHEVKATKVVSLTLHVGEVRDIHEQLLQHYFDYFSRGTIAEGVQVTMVTIPLRYRCDVCGEVYGYDLIKESILCVNGKHGLDNSTLTKNEQKSEGICSCGCDHEVGEKPHCLTHKDASITVISGTELFIEEIGVV